MKSITTLMGRQLKSIPYYDYSCSSRLALKICTTKAFEPIAILDFQLLHFLSPEEQAKGSKDFYSQYVKRDGAKLWYYYYYLLPILTDKGKGLFCQNGVWVSCRVRYAVSLK